MLNNETVLLLRKAGVAKVHATFKNILKCYQNNHSYNLKYDKRYLGNFNLNITLLTFSCKHYFYLLVEFMKVIPET